MYKLSLLTSMVDKSKWELRYRDSVYKYIELCI